MKEMKKHPGIIELIDHGEDKYTKASGKTKNVYFLVLEIAKGGELFDYISETGAFDER